jgi:two-component system, OmpR family, response regulator RpaB
MLNRLTDHNRTILIADDEASVRQILETRLRLKGYTVLTAANGQEALDTCDAQVPDLLVLDIMMPKLDGYAVCKTLREKSEIPIIMLTALSDVSRRVKGLEMGADDYMVKPFSPKELEARIDCILRRVSRPTKNEASPPGIIEAGCLRIDMNKRQVHKAKERIRLTGLEFSLLELLVSRSGEVISRHEIFKQVWGFDTEILCGLIDKRVIDVHLSRLRLKIEEDPTNPEFILTIRGEGYQFQRIEGMGSLLAQTDESHKTRYSAPRYPLKH